MVVKLNIDGREVALLKPVSILEAARSVGIDIPSLCYDERLGAYGSCRLCIVEADGKLVTSCTTQVRDGMVVRTETEEVKRIRTQLLKMLAERYPAKAVSSRALELMKRYGVEPQGQELPELTDSRHPWIQVDLSKCVLCYNCVRVCENYIGRLIWRTVYRGKQVMVMPETGSLSTSSCISCRACVDVCPSGALTDKVMAFSRPDSYASSVCSLCSVSCPIRVGYQGGKPVYVEGVGQPSASSCLKGKYHWEDYVYVPERPGQARLRQDGRLRPVDLEEAAAEVAKELRKAVNDGGPGSVGVIVASRLPMEAYYLAQMVARAGLGTNNVDSAFTLHSSAPASELEEALGTHMATMPLEDLAISSTIVVVGPVEDLHPAAGYMARRASLQGSARLVLIAPEDDKLANAADVHIAVKSGDEAATLEALEAAIAESGASLSGPRWAVETVASRRGLLRSLAGRLGVRPEDLVKAARYIAEGPTAFLLELDGSPWVAREAAAIALATGNVGRRGSGVIPLYSYYDSPEASIMGVTPSSVPGGDVVRLEKLTGLRPPEGEGMGAREMLEAARDGRMRALLIIGQLDMASQSPQREWILEALQRTPFVATLSTTAGPTALYASRIHIPIASHVEEEGVYMGVDRSLTLAEGAPRPQGVMRAWEAMASLLSLLANRRYQSARQAWDEARSLVPGLEAASYELIRRLGRAKYPLSVDGSPTYYYAPRA